MCALSQIATAYMETEQDTLYMFNLLKWTYDNDYMIKDDYIAFVNPKKQIVNVPVKCIVLLQWAYSAE